MRKLKLLVCLAFILGLSGFELYRGIGAEGRTGVSTLDAPTGVLATDNIYNSKVGIYWDAIRGATLYRIFRNTTNNTATAVDIGTTASNSFFDAGATPGQTFFYWVRAESGSTLSALSVPDQGTRANAQQQGPVPPLDPPPVPPGNPVTAAKAYLGKSLFWDEQMSSTRTVACGTCHHSGNGGTDARSVAAASAAMNPGPDGLVGTADDIRGSMGVPSNNLDGTYNFLAPYGMNEQVTVRKPVSYVNAAYAPVLFWDGRALGTFTDPITGSVVLNNGAALESQSLFPPVGTAEMAHGGRDWTDVATRMTTAQPLALATNVPTALTTWIAGRSYPELFQEAFGTPDVTPSRIAMAIGSYERTLYGDQTPIDLSNAGIAPLTDQENRGRGTFNAVGCNTCHVGNLFTDQGFHYIGVRPQTDDTGRFQVTGNTQNIGEMRTPSLRNVELRGSYFHNGQFTTLDQVVAFYNRGGDFNAPNKPPVIRPLGLSPQQQTDLVAFLKRPLTDPRVAAEAAPFDRPTLYGESSHVPQMTGSGRAGSGSFTPQIKATSPPLVGNPNFTVSVSNALGNSAAVLVVDSADPGAGSTIPTTGSFARTTATTQNTGAGNGWASISLPIPDSAALVGKTFFARWYVTDPSAANGFSVSQAVKFTIFGQASAPAKAKFDDFDGDGKTDISVFRPSEGNWYILRSGDSTVTAQNFGLSTDVLVPADYDGDGKTDVAVFRDGTWYISESTNGFTVINFGQAGDIPQPGDYDGDGIADVAVYRPSGGVWYMQKSRDGFAAVQFGISTDKPVAGDFDGDGKADQAVYRNGVWYLNQSTNGFYAVQFGLSDDRPVMGDYDGDGKTDVAVWRPSTGVWFVLRSSDGTFTGAGFGLPTDIPAPGDYDGDGSNDLAVFRPDGGYWYLQSPTTGSFRVQQFGAPTDKPVPSSIVP